MAAQATNKDKDRRIVHCLLCEKPQELLPAHLARVCMKTKTKEEREAEVQRAKDSTKAWTRQARNWDYNDLCRLIPHRPSRQALLQELHRRNFFITNPPNEADLEPEGEQLSTSAAAVQSPPCVTGSMEQMESPGEETSSHSGKDVGPNDPKGQRDSAQCHSVRIKMNELKLYARFPRKDPYLVGFKGFLKSMSLSGYYQQAIDNVSRMLRFIQSEGENITLDFLEKSTETRDFINKLSHAGSGPATILNYIKHMIKFMQYLKTMLDVAAEDPTFYTRCTAYIDLLIALRKSVAKSLRDSACKKGYSDFLKRISSIHDCQAVLRKAKTDNLDILGRLLEHSHVQPAEKTLYRYYCEAILVLQHFQRPEVVKGLRVTEWLNRKNVGGRFCVVVSDHKTAAMQTATFALTEQENAFLDAYYLHIRPECLREEVDDEDRFFISTTGGAVKVVNDVNRLHEHYKLPSVTSQIIRRVAETESNKSLSESQRAVVANYMGYSTAVAKAHDRMMTMNGTVEGADLLSCLAGSSPEEPDEGGGCRGQKRSREPVDHESKSINDFLEAFPVTVDGKPPTKRQRAEAGFSTDRVFYDKWRSLQFAKREEFLLSRCTTHPPTIQRVNKRIEKEGWTANYPRAEDIVAKWTPAEKVQLEMDAKIMHNVRKQKWKGLAIKEFDDSKGEGVVTTRAFAKGSIICDYHGTIIDAAVATQRMDAIHDNRYYFFFFKHGDQALCVDAQASSCQCHPEKRTFGRMINHSKNKSNIKPIHCMMKFSEGEEHTILFQASRDIRVDEELLFDYGVRRRSEGLEMKWLDD